MKIVALIPLRGGSKGIAKKNIKPIAGRPLSGWVLEAAAKSRLIHDAYVSTDSEEIEAVVGSLGYGTKIIARPAEFATDSASTESVMMHFMTQVDFDILLTIQATSPLLNTLDIDRAIGQFQDQKLDSMLSAVRTKRFFWNDDSTPINYDPVYRPRRQDFKGTLMENGAFYITRKSILEKNHCRLGGKVGIFEMDESSACEIDEPEDWTRVESLLLQRENKIQSSVL